MTENHEEWLAKLSVKVSPDAFCGEVMVRSAVVALLSNALRFTSLREVAELEVAASVERENVVYYVWSNRAGFELKHRWK